MRGLWGFNGGLLLLPHAADIAGVRFGAHVIGDLAYLQTTLPPTTGICTSIQALPDSADKMEALT